MDLCYRIVGSKGLEFGGMSLEFNVKHQASRTFHILILLLLMISELSFLRLSGYSAETNTPKPTVKQVSVKRIEPDPRGGKGYKLTYMVQLPIDIYWKFKTDFDNDFLVTNKFIREHQFISRSGDSSITENKYVNAPDVFFRWQTRMYSERHRLDL